jgi:16S rRNA (guanine527-N7)-methyltransferase
VSGLGDSIGALIDRYHLDANAGAAFRALLELVAGDPHAPTTVRDPGQAVDEHLADSLVALELEPVRSAAMVLDLGSGAGFPGLPLAIARPDAEFLLVEANARKCAFIQRAATVAGIGNVGVVHARAEELTDQRVALVTARAVAPLAVLAEYAAPLLATGGALVAWRGRRDPDGERDAAAAAELVGLEVREPARVQPFPAAEHRHLHLMLKVRPTPDRFPRRPGVALKRPLGARSAPASDRPQR